MEFVYSTESIGKVTEMERKFVPERFLEASLAAPCPRYIMRKVVKDIMAARAVYVGKGANAWVKKFIRLYAFMGGVGELVQKENGFEIVEIIPPTMVEAFPEQKTLQTHYPTNNPKLLGEGRQPKVKVMGSVIPIDMPGYDCNRLFFVGDVEAKEAQIHKEIVYNNADGVEFVDSWRIGGTLDERRRAWVHTLLECTHTYRISGEAMRSRDALLQTVAGCWMNLYSVIVDVGGVV